MKNSLTQLQLMRFVSPSLPVGAFSWSQGFESAVELGFVNDKNSAQDWLYTVMKNGMGHLDLPVMQKIFVALHDGCQQQENYWNRFIFAARETRELQQEDQQIARALFRLLSDVAPETLKEYSAEKTYPGLFVRAAFYHQADLDQTLQAYLWAWLENQVAAAGKLVPLGQTDMQKIIGELLPCIPELCQQAKTIPEEDIGFSLPGLIYASVKHETQYSRLFRS